MNHNLYSKIININNLFLAYKRFRRGKRAKKEVAEFEIDLEENIFSLHNLLKNKSYSHSSYKEFKICDPKPRIIHKASINDRIIHQAIYQIIEPIFDKIFIYDSYSSRIGKGHHKAVKRLTSFVKKVSANYKKECWYLKMDIKKFFDSVDQNILIDALKEKIQCKEIIFLLKIIIKSYQTVFGKGIPLGNVISQLFANIYLDKLDKFVKCKFRQRYYIRFCDDFIVLDSKQKLIKIKKIIKVFVKNKLKLDIVDSKIKIDKLSRGFDYLGYKILTYHTILRSKTKKRMFKKLRNKKRQNNQTYNRSLQSYLGLIKHCDSYKIKKQLEKL